MWGLLVLRQVDRGQEPVAAEQLGRQRPRQLGLAHAAGADEQEDAQRGVGVGEPGLGRAQRLGHLADGLGLAAHRRAQPALQPQQRRRLVAGPRSRPAPPVQSETTRATTAGVTSGYTIGASPCISASAAASRTTSARRPGRVGGQVVERRGRRDGRRRAVPAGGRRRGGGRGFERALDGRRVRRAPRRRWPRRRWPRRRWPRRRWPRRRWRRRRWPRRRWPRRRWPRRRWPRRRWPRRRWPRRRWPRRRWPRRRRCGGGPRPAGGRGRALGATARGASSRSASRASRRASSASTASGVVAEPGGQVAADARRLDGQVPEPALGVVEGVRQAGLAQADPGGGRVHQVHGFVGQLAAGDVPVRQLGHRVDGLGRDRDAVVGLVARLEPAEHDRPRRPAVGSSMNTGWKRRSSAGSVLDVLFVLGPRRRRDPSSARRARAPA